MKKLIPLIIISFLIISCNKGTNIAAFDSNYVGDWIGKADSGNHYSMVPFAELIINSQSNVSFTSYRSNEEHDEEIERIAEINGKLIKVSQPIFPYKFEIKSPLTQINSTTVGGYHWTITLRGQKYTYTYYRH